MVFKARIGANGLQRNTIKFINLNNYKMKKKLLFYNEIEALKEIKAIEANMLKLQSVIDEFSKLGADITVSIPELKSFLKPGNRYCEANEKTISQTLAQKLIPDGKLGGVPVNFDTIDQFLQLPPIDEVTRLISKTKPEAISHLDLFSIEHNVLAFSDEMRDRITEKYKVYISTEAEEKQYQQALQLAEALTSIDKDLGQNEKLQEIGDLQRVVEWDDAGKKYIPNIDFVKTGKAGKYFDVAVMARGNMKVKEVPISTPTELNYSSEFLQRLQTGTKE